MSVFSKLKSAILKSLIGRYSVYIIQIICLAIYSRFFTPEEFGIFAAIQVFAVFFLMLGDIGFGPAIINFKKLEDRDRDGLFSLTIVVGVILSFIFYLFSYWLNYFYDRDDYQYLSLFVCISIIFSCANTLPNSFLLREKKFFRIAFSDIVAEIASFLVVIYIFNFFDSVYALASRPCVVAIVRFATNYCFHLCITEFGVPKINWYPRAVLPILSFSTYQFMFNLMNYFSRNLDNILVGKYFGLSVLGVYEKSYMIMKYPLQLVSFAIGPAIQPILSQECDNIDIVKRIHNKLILNLSIISSMIGFLVYCNSELIIKVLLGEQWFEVEGILVILSFSIPIQILLSTSGSVFQSLNKTKQMFYSGVFSSLCNIFGMVYSAMYGDVYLLTKVLVLTFYINFFQCYYLMYHRVFKESLKLFLILLIPATVSLLSSLLTYHVILINSSDDVLSKLLISLCISFFIFLSFYKISLTIPFYKRVSDVS